MNFLVNLIGTVAVILWLNGNLVEAHPWVKNEVLTKIIEGQPSLSDFTRKMTGKKDSMCHLHVNYSKRTIFLR